MARGHHGDGFPIGDGLPELRHGEKQDSLFNNPSLCFKKSNLCAAAGLNKQPLQLLRAQDLSPQARVTAVEMPSES